MRLMVGITFLVVTFLAIFTLHVHAEEQPNDPAIVRGLVVSSGLDLTINDGVRDYLLLGVDNSEFEGKVCEVIGSLSIGEIMPEIEVKTITVITDKYPDHDLIGFQRGVGSPYLVRRRLGIQGNAMVSPGVAMPCLRTLALPIWDRAVCVEARCDRFTLNIPSLIRT